MNLIKNTAVAMTIGLPELTMRANEMGEATFQFFAAYLWATVLYIAIALCVNRLMAWMEARCAIPASSPPSKQRSRSWISLRLRTAGLHPFGRAYTVQLTAITLWRPLPRNAARPLPHSESAGSPPPQALQST